MEKETLPQFFCLNRNARSRILGLTTAALCIFLDFPVVSGVTQGEEQQNDSISLTASVVPSTPEVALFPVRYSSNGRYLVDQNDIPFPIKGRTAWFAAALSSSDYHIFIDDTAARGFSAIEFHVVNHDSRGINPPFNNNGDLPFLRRLNGTNWDGSLSYGNINSEAPDFTTPNEAYWSNVDGLLSYCETKGILVFFFPAYVGYGGGSQGWMQEIVANGTSKMQSYGAWIATRYRNQRNLVWMMGGDMGTPPDTFNSTQTAVENALLTGLKSVSGQQSIFFSAEWTSGSIATDQTTFGSQMTLNGAYAHTGDVNTQGRRAYVHTPIEPGFLLEGPYDQEGPDGNGDNSSAIQPIRRFQWWSWLSTIGGYIVGNGYIIWFRAPAWQNHLDTQCTRDMTRLNSFMGSIAWYDLVPSGLSGMRTIVTAGGSAVDSSTYVAAAADPDGTMMVAYIPPDHTGPITIDMGVMSGPSQARWFDPTSAVYTTIGTGLPNSGGRVFTPPGNNSVGEHDWVLRIETSTGGTTPTPAPTSTATATATAAASPPPPPTTTPTSSSPTPTPGSAFVSDSMTGSDGTDLTAHTGEIGATWTRVAGFGGVIKLTSNRCKGDSGGVSFYYASGNPASPEYDVEADIYKISNTDQPGIGGRISINADTGYFVWATPSNEWHLVKVVSGTQTDLGSFDQVLVSGVTYHVELQIRNTSKKVFIDGVERISSADNSITAPGKAGIRYSNSDWGFGTTGKPIDNFLSTNLPGAASPTPPPSPTPVSTPTPTPSLTPPPPASSTPTPQPSPPSTTPVPSSTPTSGGTFVSDSMTGNDGTDLIAHTGEIGATWARVPGFGGVIKLTSNRCKGDSGGVSFYYASGNPASPEYDVKADIYKISNTDQPGIGGRISINADTGYFVWATPSNEWHLVKVVSGTQTDLGSFDQVLVNGVTYHVELQIRNTSKKVFIDGVERISSSDNSITAAGKAGIRYSNSDWGFGTTGKPVDNLVATNVATSGTPTPPPSTPTPVPTTTPTPPTTPTPTPASGLIAAYSFDEGTGTTVNDDSGNGLTGIIQGATWVASGRYGSALSFDGAASFVDLGNPAALQITGSLTLSAWVKAAANPPDDGQIVAKSDSSSGWQLKTSQDTGPQTFGTRVSGGSNTLAKRYSTTARSLNVWYHVAGVYDATAGTLDTYVNGVLDNGVLRGTVPSSQTNSAVNATIGRRTGGFYFDGIIDEVRIYSRALTGPEIQADMNTPISGN